MSGPLLPLLLLAIPALVGVGVVVAALVSLFVPVSPRATVAVPRAVARAVPRLAHGSVPPRQQPTPARRLEHAPPAPIPVRRVPHTVRRTRLVSDFGEDAPTTVFVGCVR
jgi:hypothetical protein